MARQKRQWHKNFIKYMEFIVSHSNYSGMPEVRKPDGSIRWVVTGKSEIGQAREKWWDKRRRELGIEKEPGWKAKTAFAIHPTKIKVCQICGESMRLEYVYPNKACPLHMDINAICPGNKKCKEAINQYNRNCPHLGPGAMSDCPDRLDGFHTFNRCCRSREDTGRHADNLERYGEDRRAYEFWCDGDWKAASWLMKVFQKHGVSADHIGPISLGFCHRPCFQPMTGAKNSSKGNRLSFLDVKRLIADEEDGQNVISWNSKYVWDKYKNQVATDAQAKKLSYIMRKHLHTVLNVLAIIHQRGYDDFLTRFLHPEYAFYQHEFIGFDPTTGNYKSILSTEVGRTEHKRNAQRYLAKSFLALEKYTKKLNRNVDMYDTSDQSQKCLKLIFVALSKNKCVSAQKYMDLFLRKLAKDITDKL